MALDVVNDRGAAPYRAAPDVVYVVKPGDRNEELRYSLRSIARHLPHSQVWIAGYKPRWLTGVRYISVIQRKTKYENSTANLQAACAHPEVSDRFVYFNDDMFVMKPIDKIPTLHRGPLDDVIRYYAGRTNHYTQGMVATKALLEHLDRPRNLLSYELHVPMIFDKAKLQHVLGLSHSSAVRDPKLPSRRLRITALHKRTLYGNYYRVGGRSYTDCKVFSFDQSWRRDRVFLSTSDQTFRDGAIGRFLRETFSEPSPYERSTDVRIARVS